MIRPRTVARLWAWSVVLLGGTAIGRTDAPPGDTALPPGHPAEGLPDPARPTLAYAADPDHPLNRIFALLFRADRVPREVGAVLPSEREAEATADAAFFVPGWYFRKRPGADADRAEFGGDVRVSPVESWSAENAARLVALLGRVDEPAEVDALPELRAPLARLMFQWDLLNVWARVEKSGRADAAVLQALARAVRACGQPADVLRSLPDGVADLHRQFPGGEPRDRRAPYLPPTLLGDDPGSTWVEVDRRSSTLFHGAASFRAVRVFLDAGSVEASRALVEAAARQGKDQPPPPVAVGSRAALVFSLVGVTPDLHPVATPVVDEVRVRTLATPPRLDPAGDTSTVDGVNFWTYFRRRPGATDDPARPAFRFIADTSQSLFLEYGTAKRTTFRGQCALCHRTTSDGGQTPAGLRSLSRFAKPHVIDDPATRLRLAEREIVPTLNKLRARIGDGPPGG